MDGTGGDGATCAFASAFPETVVPEQPIGVRFELLYDPDIDDPSNLASWIDFTDDCGDSALGPEDFPGFAPWGECVARHFVDSINGAFAELLGSDAPLFAFDSFTASPNAALARGLGQSELPSAVEPLTQPGLLNAFLVQDVEGSIAGVARLSQAYPSEFKGFAAIMEATQPWYGLAHEIGHAMGFPHVGGPTTSGLARYECCGGLEAETLSGYCSANLMCERAGSSFNTCEHGEFLKRIAACWLSGQGGPTCGGHVCAFSGPDDTLIAYCDDAEGGLTCTCVESLATFDAVDCNDAVVRFNDICNPPRPRCEIFGESTCAEGEGCYPVLGEDPQCFPLGTIPLGEDCTAPTTCVEGAVCQPIDAEDQGACSTICEIVSDASEDPECFMGCTAIYQWSDTVAVCVK